MTSRKPIIITGAGQRLGLACAKALIAQGNEVIITYRTERKGVAELKALGAHCIQADFSSVAGVESFVSAILHQYSALGGIIHNASEWLSETEGEDSAVLMEKMWQVHVFAPYRLNLAFEPLLLAGYEASGYADIIHMTDYVAEKGSDKHIAYAASKAGLANLTHSFSKRFAPQVKVNAIAPSLLMFNNDDDEEYRQKALSKSLLRKSPGEQEGVLAVQYILSSQYMTGRTLSLDGGRHLA